MSRMRSKMSKKNKWYIEPERYLELKHFCLQYPELLDAKKSATVIQASNVKLHEGSKYEIDLTSEAAIHLASLNRRIEMIEESAKEASGKDIHMYDWIMMGVTKDISYDSMHMLGIPCGKDYYYEAYHKFFYILDQKRD